jgi:CheY-like chemotaxis protein
MQGQKACAPLRRAGLTSSLGWEAKMELLSVEYDDLPDLFNGEEIQAKNSACLIIHLSVDPVLVSDREVVLRAMDKLSPVLPAACSAVPAEADLAEGAEGIACLTGGVILELQRDLCEWPGASCVRCRHLSANEYELYVECIDEQVGRFAAHLIVQVMRMMLLGEPFEPRLTWVIDLVRHLRRQPRLRLSSRRVASLLGCSRSSADWAIQELERYGYLDARELRRPRRSRGGRILIIDDSAQIRDLLSRTLEWLGYDVITAVDGEEGLILLDWTSYKAIFVDLAMPGLDGTVFLQRAREEGVTSPIFVISAYEYRWDIEHVQELGATAFIRKPFSISEIEELFKKHVK